MLILFNIFIIYSLNYNHISQILYLRTELDFLYSQYLILQLEKKC